MSGRPSSSITALQRRLPAFGAALSVVAIFIAVLSIPLAVASELQLSAAETVGWIVALYGVSGALSVALVLRYRQPLLLTGNLFVLIFVASLGGQLTWPELVGAAMAASGLVLLLGALGLTDWLAAWLPAPIVYGLLAGAVLPFFVDLFTALGDARLVVGGALAAYLLGRIVAGPRLPAIVPAIVVGLLVAGLLGRLGAAPTAVVWPIPAVTAPVFSLPALLTATPVIVVLVTLQANVPSVVFLHAQGYRPPAQMITAVSGIGTLMASLLGPAGISLSLPATALCAGPNAGARHSALGGGRRGRRRGGRRVAGRAGRGADRDHPRATAVGHRRAGGGRRARPGAAADGTGTVAARADVRVRGGAQRVDVVRPRLVLLGACGGPDRLVSPRAVRVDDNPR